MTQTSSWYSFIGCCYSREAGRNEHGYASTYDAMPPTINALDESDEWAFFDCAETEEELAALLRSSFSKGKYRSHAYSTTSPKAPMREPGTGREDCCSDLGARDCSHVDLVAARAVLERTREQWMERMARLVPRKGGGASGKGTEKGVGSPELDWATLSNADRMLRAMRGDVQKAVTLFLQAMEARQRDRHLYTSMRCEPRSDLRIIGRDAVGHPAVYMCARSQQAPLADIREQCIVTFEAACKLTSDQGQVFFIFDMHGLSPKLNMDLLAMKDLTDVLGTVYAERIHKLIIVDFARGAQAIWWMLKPVLAESTRGKFNFVGRDKAESMCREYFDDEVFQSIQQSFEINRDPKSTAEDRALHARRTTMCDVPLGPPLT